MCRRFSITAGLEDIRRYFSVDRVMYYYKSRYNISPTQNMPVIIQDEGGRMLDELRWGLVPYWGKDAVNADLGTVHQNPTYRKTLETRRCIIPCNGFYYQRTVGRKSYAVRVVTEEQGLFGIAGLYEVWRNAKGEETGTCTMLMTEANVHIREFENRMPAILSGEDLEAWLHPEGRNVYGLEQLLKTYPGNMRIYPVTPLVTNDNHDHPQCIEEMDLKLAWVKNI